MNNNDNITETLKRLEEISKLFEGIKPEFNDSERSAVDPQIKMSDTTKIGKIAPLLNPEDEGMLKDPHAPKEVDLHSFESNDDVINFLKMMCVPTKLKTLNSKEFIKTVKQFHELFEVLVGNLPFILAFSKHHKLNITKDQLIGHIAESAMKEKIKKIYSNKDTINKSTIFKDSPTK